VSLLETGQSQQPETTLHRPTSAPGLLADRVIVPTRASAGAAAPLAERAQARALPVLPVGATWGTTPRCRRASPRHVCGSPARAHHRRGAPAPRCVQSTHPRAPESRGPVASPRDDEGQRRAGLSNPLDAEVRRGVGRRPTSRPATGRPAKQPRGRRDSYRRHAAAPASRLRRLHSTHGGSSCRTIALIAMTVPRWLALRRHLDHAGCRVVARAA
jgi:hypothetical protein